MQWLRNESNKKNNKELESNKEKETYIKKYLTWKLEYKVKDNKECIPGRY